MLGLMSIGCSGVLCGTAGRGVSCGWHKLSSEGGEETLGFVREIGSDHCSGWESLRTRPED